MGDVLLYKLRDSNYSLISFDDREKSLLLNLAMDQFVKERVVADLNVKQKGAEIDAKRKLDISGLITAHKAFRRISIEINGHSDFILGNEDNGGLRGPDRDYQVETISFNNGPAIANYSIFCRIPDECLFIVSESCDTSKQNQIKTGVPVEEVSHEEYNAGINNALKQPYYNKVWRVDFGSYSVAGSNDISSKFTGSTLTGFYGTSANPLESEDPVTIETYRSACLISGKDWQIDKYHIRYIKRPQRIMVDTITPSNQRNCELHPAVHDEIIEIAVRLAIAAKIPEQQKYQVADKEQKETE